MELHRGILIVIVVRVGIEHQQGTRTAEISCYVIVSTAELLEHLHLLCIHRDVLHLIKSTDSQHVLTSIHLLLQLLSVLVHLALVHHSECERALTAGGFLLTDEQFHAPALCSRLETLLSQGTIER